MIAPLVLLLSACGPGQNDPGPGAVTQGEARALDDAADMLEQRRITPQELRDAPAMDTAPGSENGGEGAQGDAGR